MKCCKIEMIPEGNGLVCTKCGNWLSALEVKFGKEPIINDFNDHKWDWH